MSILNIEFKAIMGDLLMAEKILLEQGPEYKGEDHQIDTYFNVPFGRLKLREGNIENALIHYQRPDTAGSKASQVLLYQHQPDANLKALLSKAIGIKAVVDKKRKIYFLENVKFHFDTVQQLGTFIEVEAIDTDDSIGAVRLQRQCDHYAALFNIQPADYIAVSYCDLLMNGANIVNNLA